MTARTVTLLFLVVLSTSAPVGVSAQQELGELAIGRPFPDISLPDLDGNRRSITDFRGHKLILHVFASW